MDKDCFNFLTSLTVKDEINFWKPSGGYHLRALNLGDPFLFELYAPEHFIVGGGFFAHSTFFPISLARDSFRKKNGSASFDGIGNASAKCVGIEARGYYHG